MKFEVGEIAVVAPGAFCEKTGLGPGDEVMVVEVGPFWLRRGLFRRLRIDYAIEDRHGDVHACHECALRKRRPPADLARYFRPAEQRAAA